MNNAGPLTHITFLWGMVGIFSYVLGYFLFTPFSGWHSSWWYDTSHRAGLIYNKIFLLGVKKEKVLKFLLNVIS